MIDGRDAARETFCVCGGLDAAGEPRVRCEFTRFTLIFSIADAQAFFQALLLAVEEALAAAAPEEVRMKKTMLAVQHACGHLWRYPVELPAELRRRLEQNLTADCCPNCQSGATKPEPAMRTREKTP